MAHRPLKIKGPLKVAYKNIDEDITEDRMLITATIHRIEEIQRENISQNAKIHVIKQIDIRIRQLCQRIFSSKDKKKILSCG